MTKNKAINQYHTTLREELSKRYGGVSEYSEAQVLKTINDLDLNSKYIDYAYFLFCGNQYLVKNNIDSNKSSIITEEVKKAFDGGLLSKPIAKIGKLVSGSGGDVGFGGGGE